MSWSPASTAGERQQALAAIAGALVGTVHSGLMRRLGQGPVDLISLPPGLSMDQALQIVRRRSGVDLAEPDGLVQSQVTANDPAYSGGQLWGMYSSDTPTAAGPTNTTNVFGSQAEQAWNQGTMGSSKVVVGVVDEGIDYTHPDLYLNIWLNQGEIRGLSFFSGLTDVNSDGLINFRDLNASVNTAFVTDLNGNGRIDAGDLLRDSRWADGLDNDGNGYRDDLVGWDFYNNSNDPYRPGDGDNHGTHVSGTIAGIGGNGVGVAGVNWEGQLMSLKFLGPSGGYTSGAVSALNYYADIASRQDIAYGGAANFVATNNSWGGGGFSSTLQNAIINTAKVGSLFVAAAGNGGGDGTGDNNDTTANYPSNYSTRSALGWDAVVAVAAINSSGSLAAFSNYGSSTVDLGAPGVSVYSTVAGGGYAIYSGTSMATPHVTGSLGLMASAYPQATPQQLLQALYGGATATASLSGRTVSGGRLNVQASLQQLASALGGGGGGSTPPPSPITDPPKTIWGSTASDDLTGTRGGGSGADQIAGVPATGLDAASLGRGQIDRVTGGAGADLFLLADQRGTFYNDGNNKNSGSSDHLLIGDFTASEDKVQLRAGSQYLVRNVTISGVPYTEIFLGDGNNTFNGADELIGRLQGTALAPGSGAWILANPGWTTTI